MTVDATTRFAFVLSEVLARNGLQESELTFERAGDVSNRLRAMTANAPLVATAQMTPFELLGEACNFNTLARASEVIGAYMGMTTVVRQSWAEANRPVVVSFARGYQKPIGWMFKAGKRAGFQRKIGFDHQAAKTVIELRSKYG